MLCSFCFVFPSVSFLFLCNFYFLFEIGGGGGVGFRTTIVFYGICFTFSSLALQLLPRCCLLFCTTVDFSPTIHTISWLEQTMKVTFFCNTQAFIANSIDEGFFGQLKLDTSKLLFGGHSGITLKCSLSPNGQLPIANAQSNIY